jgi:hypothetical protein
VRACSLPPSLPDDVPWPLAEGLLTVVRIQVLRTKESRASCIHVLG